MRRSSYYKGAFTAGLLLWGAFQAAIVWAGTEEAPWVGTDLQGKRCEGTYMNYGPYDYMQRSALPPGRLSVVERYHFTQAIEQLRDGETTFPNIGYTLRAWPNHHRALYAMIRGSEMPELKLGQAKATPVECYLQRAVNFSPDDATTRMLYGIFLQGRRKYQDALKQYRVAERLEPANFQVKYNLGLVLLDLGQYQESRDYAREVYAKNFPLPGLRDRLNAAGYKVEGG